MAQKISKEDFISLVRSELNAYNNAAHPDDVVNLEDWLDMNCEFYRNEYGFYYSSTQEGYVYDKSHDRFITEEA